MTSGSDTVEAGTRVQVRFQVLAPSERPAGLPEDTARVPYEARVRGRLIGTGRVGDRVSVRTAVGRELQGELELVEPADLHTFGRPPAALVAAVEPMPTLLEAPA